MTLSSKLLGRTFLVAASAASIATAVTSAVAADWKLDPSKSTLGFSGTQTGAAFEGKFSSYSAAVAFDPDHPETSHISVTVDLASAVTGDTQRDTALPGKTWFDTAEFPQARFDADSIRRTGAGSYEASGKLTLRGVTHSLVLPFTLDLNGAAAHAKGHVSLLRSDFGVGQGGPWSSGQWVALEVNVDVDIVATRSN
jgi:polyisoprenoid-binding protein YceI